MPAPNQGYAPAEPAGFQPASDPAHFSPEHDHTRMGAAQQAYAEPDHEFDEALAEGRLKSGQLAVLSGFGAGLSWGTAVMRW